MFRQAEFACERAHIDRVVMRAGLYSQNIGSRVRPIEKVLSRRSILAYNNDFAMI
jgi:hypothetical protein